MTAAWVLYVLLVGALAALAAASVAAATRAVGRPTRWVWAAALAGLAVLAVVAPRQEPTRLRVATTIETSAPTIARQPVASMDLVARLRAARDLAAEEGTSALASAARAVPRPVTIAFAAAWAAGSAALLALFVAVNLRLARARRRWPASRTCGTPVRVAPHSGPAVLGLLRAEIVVPRSLLERSAEEQRLILVHEREHLRARDHLLLAGAWLVAIALPWHPAVWAMLARLRLAIELDCDARVIHAGVSPKSYGALLIDVAVHHEGIRIGALALADGPSHLERRILAMNAPRRRHARTYGAVLGGLGTLLVLAACEAKIPTSADIAAMDVASAQKSAAEAGFMRTPSNDRTDFFLNGVKVSAEQARALEAKNIGSIEVVKSERPEGRDTIFVTTADRMPKTSNQSGELLMLPGQSDAPGKRPVVMIDGVVASEGDLSRVKNSEIVAVHVFKSKQDARYPNGLIELTTRGAVRESSAQSSRARPVTRTDSVIVRSSMGLSNASRLWSRSAVDGAGPHRVVVMPGKELRDSNVVTVDRVMQAAPIAETTPAMRHARPSSPVGWDEHGTHLITIDGVKATQAELDALPRGEISHVDVYGSASAVQRSSDPAAINGLLEVTTKASAKRQ